MSSFPNGPSVHETFHLAFKPGGRTVRVNICRAPWKHMSGFITAVNLPHFIIRLNLRVARSCWTPPPCHDGGQEVIFYSRASLTLIKPMFWLVYGRSSSSNRETSKSSLTSGQNCCSQRGIKCKMLIIKKKAPEIKALGFSFVVGAAKLDDASV